jgi:hypothetical protein
VNSSSNTSVADIVALVCGVAMIVGFLFMPWVSFLGLNATGWTLLSMANAATNNPNTTSGSADGLLWLTVLILAAGVCGTATALWGLTRPAGRRAASIWSLIAGLVAVVPLLILVVQASSNQTTSSYSTLGSSLIGSGVWITLLGAAGLVVQKFLPRPSLN